MSQEPRDELVQVKKKRSKRKDKKKAKRDVEELKKEAELVSVLTTFRRVPCEILCFPTFLFSLNFENNE
jgi:hypothetical protein